MAKIGVAVKIDVTKIDKERLFKGAKGTYLDATVFVDLGEADQYGNHGMITQDVSKEERQSGTKGAILGNVKIFYRDGVPESGAAPSPAPAGGGATYSSGGPDAFGEPDDEIPF